MAHEFIDFASGQSTLHPDDFLDRITSIMKRLHDVAEKAKNEILANPLDEELASKNLFLVEEYLAFAELVACGNRLTLDALHQMKIDALKDPEDPYNAKILKTLNLLESLNEQVDTFVTNVPLNNPKKGTPNSSN